nr:MAG TPA: hypothetical protein [Caudoviricetes sp.]
MKMTIAPPFERHLYCIVFLLKGGYNTIQMRWLTIQIGTNGAVNYLTKIFSVWYNKSRHKQSERRETAAERKEDY